MAYDLIPTELIAFVGAEEGRVLRAYRDPVGILTIGYGFTMRSSLFAPWAMEKWGRALQMGDSITLQEADDLLGRLLDDEYAPYVQRRFNGKRNLPPHEIGACTSNTFNLGPATLGWSWAEFLAQGKVSEAAARLRITGTTAQGKSLPGLVKRREREARLLEHGDWGFGAAVIGTAGAPSVSNSQEAIKKYQTQLKKLGYYSGTIDGVAGPLTMGAVQNFQRQEGLTVDGIVGPATRAVLDRREAALTAVATTRNATVGVGATAGGIDTATGAADGANSALLWAIGAGAVTLLVVGVGFLLWRNRKRMLLAAELAVPAIQPLTRKWFPEKPLSAAERE